MKIEESFLKSLTEIQRTYPVLKERNETKVTIRVSSIITIAKAFHAKGWKDSDPLSVFADLLGKK